MWRKRSSVPGIANDCVGGPLILIGIVLAVACGWRGLKAFGESPSDAITTALPANDSSQSSTDVTLRAKQVAPFSPAASPGSSNHAKVGGINKAAKAKPATKSDKAAQAAALVSEALYYEIYGATDKRNQLLADARNLAPDYQPAMWHSGMVQYQDKWLTIENLIASTANNPRLKKYVSKREATADNVAGNLYLANWCASQQLDEQARAHYATVLQYEPTNTVARAALGYRNVNGVWLTADEYEQKLGEQNDRLQALRAWLPKLGQIISGLASNNSEAQQAARSQFQDIHDLQAIPALEYALSGVSEQSATMLVNKLGKWQEFPATQALARQAVYSFWDSVREAAAKKLRTRPKEDYVPQLLSIMYFPAQMATSFSLFGYGPRAVPVQNEMIVREGQSDWEVESRRTFYTLMSEHGLPRDPRPLVPVAVSNVGSPVALAMANNGNFDARDLSAMKHEIKNNAATEAGALTALNYQTDEINNHAMDALAIATGQSAFVRPDDWWNWWDQQNETMYSSGKGISVLNQERDVTISDNSDYSPPTVESSDYHAPINRAVMEPHSCFVAGTPVWTATGQKPIEKVRVGDVVLSQDTESGELTFKPVMRTTVRMGAQVFSVATSGGIFEATGGHLFWVAGDGWTKARYLRSGQELHCAAGTVQVSDVTPQTQPQQTYNLVVADFDTYFVGPDKILAHDVTEKKPTKNMVPGLAKD